MKHAQLWISALAATCLFVLVYEAHEARTELRHLHGSADEIAQAEREDNYLWQHATTTDEWTGRDGWQHAVTSELREKQTLRDWFDRQNQLVDAKIASKPLAFAPKEQ